MNLLNLKKLAAALAVVCSLAFASSASAHLILVGHYTLGGPLGNPSNEAAWIEGIEGLADDTLTYLNKFDTDDQDWDNGGSVDNPGYFDANVGEDAVNGSVSWNLTGSGFQLSYVLLKSGQANYTLYEVSLDQVITSGGWDPIANNVRNGISHVTFFGVPGTTRVPDSASTLLLIGLGLASVGFVARRRKA